MSRTAPLAALFVAAACVLASAAPAAADEAPNGSFEKGLSQIGTSITAQKLRSLSVDLAQLTDEAYHMGIAPQKLEDLAWKISIISRKTETALGRLQTLAQGSVAPQKTAAQDLLQNAQDLLNELRRLEIAVPNIREQIGYANEDSRRFADEAADARRSAATIAAEAQILLARAK